MTTGDDVAEQLVGWGTVARIRTRGRVSGREAEAAIGYVEDVDGSILVAAGGPTTDWALNLDAEPRCTVVIGNVERACVAEPLDGEARARTVRDLILRYGTPAERLGAGPAYRLRPVSAAD